MIGTLITSSQSAGCLPFAHLKSNVIFNSRFCLNWILIFLGSQGYIWSSLHNEMLCREIMVVDSFTGTKKSTAAKGKKWEDVVENLNQFQSWQNGSSRSLQPSCKKNWEANWITSEIETDMSSIEVAPKEFSVLFLYSCILMSFLQIKTIIIIMIKIRMEIPGSWRRFHCIVVA